MSLAILFDWMKDRWSWSRFVICLLCLCPGYLLSGVQYFQQLDSRLGHLSRERKGNVLIARPGTEPESRSLSWWTSWESSTCRRNTEPGPLTWHSKWECLSQKLRCQWDSESVQRGSIHSTLGLRVSTQFRSKSCVVVVEPADEHDWDWLVFLPRNMTWRFVCQRKDKWYHGHHW